MADKNQVELLIKAKDEASKAIAETSKAIQQLTKKSQSASDAIVENDEHLRSLNSTFADLKSTLGNLTGIQKLVNELGRFQDSIKGTDVTLEAFKKSIVAQKSSLDNARVAYEQANKAVLDQKRVIDQLKAAHGLNSQEVINARDTLRQLQDQLKQANTELGKEENALKRIETAQQKVNEQRAKALVNYNQLSDKLRQVGINTDKLADEEERLAMEVKQTSDQMKKARTDADRYEKALRKTGAATKDTANRFSLLADNSRKSMSVIQRLRGEVLSLTAAYVGLYGIISGIGSSFEALNSEQATFNKLSAALSGNTKLVGEEMEYVKKVSKDLGLPLRELEASYASFFIASTAAGESVEATRVIFESIAKAGAVMKWSTDDIKGSLTALTQVMSKGQVMAEELQNQLGERFPGAVALMAASMNITTQELRKLMEQGKVSSQALLGFALQATDLMMPGLEGATRSMKAEMNRFKTALEEVRREFMRMNEADLAKAFRELTNLISGPKGKTAIDGLAGAFNFLVNALRLAIEHFDILSAAVKVFLALQAAKAVSNLATSMWGLHKALVAVNNLGGVAKVVLGVVTTVGTYVAIDQLTKSVGGLNEELEKTDSILTRMIESSVYWSGASVKAVGAAFHPLIDAYTKLAKLTGLITEETSNWKAELNALITSQGVLSLSKSDRPLVDLAGEIGLPAPANQVDMQSEVDRRNREMEYQALLKDIAVLQAQSDKTHADSLEEQIELVRRKYDAAIQSAIKLGAIDEENTLLELERFDIAKIRAEFALKAATAAEDRINQTFDSRKLIVEEIARLSEIGDAASISKIGKLQEELINVDQSLEIAIENAVSMWQAVGGQEADAAIARLSLLWDTINTKQERYLLTSRQVANEIAGGMARSLSEFARGLSDVFRGAKDANGEALSLADAFNRAADSFGQFASEFLIKIGEMIAQQIILNTLTNAKIIPGVQMPGGGGANNAGFNLAHTGGLAGGGSMSRAVSPQVFNNAMRYHSGGIAGLRPNEVPTILERGEEVLTRNDPRHIMNGAGGGGTDVQIYDQRGAGAPPVDVQRSNDGGMEQIKVFIRDQIESAMNSGKMDSALANNFAITRPGIRR